MSGFVTTEDVIGTQTVRWLTMSNPGRRNAVPATGWDDLADAFSGFAASDARVLVVAGADGDFCSGADMHRDLTDVPSAADNAERMRRANRAATELHRVPKPTIAAVDGVAVGAGMNLAIGCDVVIATERARFAEIFVRRGLTVDFGGTWLLPRLVGLARARELALTGRIVNADEALRIGLVAEVVSVDELPGRVESLAGDLAAGAPLAQSMIKRSLDRSSSVSFEQALAMEAQMQAVLLGSGDLREGAQAFVEKRTPHFRGR
ncbi:MAG: enoyl-CoA hydratase-related protein [Acidimicrobiia bacterium]